MTHTGREPIITTDKPCWHYEEPATGREMTYTMGYITDDLIPCMALFAGNDNTPVLIPVDILAHAVGLAAVKQHAEAAIAKATEIDDAEAASPDLLAALRQLAEATAMSKVKPRYDGGPPGNGHDEDTDRREQEVWQDAQDAIDKATGGQEEE